MVLDVAEQQLSRPVEPTEPATQKTEDQDRLRKFITARGGSVRFDQFMAESLYGAEGYYPTHAEIGTGKFVDPAQGERDFDTFAGHSLFAQMVFRYLKPDIKPEGKFIEFGGGTADFKRNFLELCLKAGIDPHYLSLDIAAQMLDKQKSLGATVAASALELPFSNKSIDGVFFMNELTDALPFRIVQSTSRKLAALCFKELSFSVDENGRIIPTYEPILWGELMDYWNRQIKIIEEMTRGRLLPAGQLPQEFVRAHTLQPFCVNLNEEKLIREIGRVLNHGIVVIIDYGDNIIGLLNEEKRFRMRPKSLEKKPEEAYKSVYRADMTTLVNFSNVCRVAEEVGFRVKAYGPMSAFFFQQMTKDEKTVFKNADEVHPWRVFYNAAKGGWFGDSAFKVLVLEK